ncbi:uncharacterized protein I206_101954 [Kwoniella pini CBS 10737]|uniref:Microfibrillar-associated protein 1 n=1 Tax=Kwoniella pini CBS 10737 TaxID=1296096 RepID=A0A1B9HV76_9TREE|nr:microfibrillar-associated protein 1 [Kwoniella pini CBS 10737]OCF47177.1 microfibrillar-associated protein 1 [Kwoniella pini CBS 10737]
MPPPPTGFRPSTAKPVAKPSKIRYFKGKAPDAPASDSDSDEDEEEQKQQVKKKSQSAKIDRSYVAGGAGRVIPSGGAVKMELGSVKVGGKGPLGSNGGVKEESSEEETDEESEEEAKAQKQGQEESSEYETDSEEEESEPEPPKPVFRPVFKLKNARVSTADKAAQEAEEAAKREEELREEKKLASKELAGETIRRELAEREAQTVEQTVDDTDDLDPTTEFDAWRARELARLLRDKQAQAARDEEQAEIERRRAMPEEQRMAEDMEFANQTRAKEKGQMGFLQKYYHKGAFHQDDEILHRDYTGATEHSVDMSMLPKVMQVRDYGKASRSKYTHLADQDTSQGGWGNTAKMGAAGALTAQNGCWNCGGPHQRKDCPNNNIIDPLAQSGQSSSYGTSANTAQLGSGSKWGNGSGHNDRDRDDRGGKYRDEGKDRRFDEERMREKDDRDYGRDRDRDRDHGRDRHRDDRKRERSYSPSSRKRDERDDRHRDERSRDKERDRYRERERDRDRDRTRDRDRRH